MPRGGSMTFGEMSWQHLSNFWLNKTNRTGCFALKDAAFRLEADPSKVGSLARISAHEASHRLAVKDR
jgi:hypothetical protein